MKGTLAFAQTRPAIRPELQALRALAVLAVILFHLWPETFPGGYVGVDVFFVISGFLITGHLMREVDATGSVNLGRFWARRVRRLLPAALLVLAATLVATLLFLPQATWQRILAEIAAASTYMLNWVLAANAVDYFAAENAASAVQHYWSLSVEEQFYLVWPLLLLVMVGAAKWRKKSPRTLFTIAVLVIGALSLGYSIWYSYAAPSAAYFSTFTHGWEFAAGAFVALRCPVPSAGRNRVRAVLVWVGIAIILACCFLFTGATVFPGWIAIIPVFAVLLVLVAGNTPGTRVLSLRPVQALGDLSYSAYLWHWPLIVVAPFVLGGELQLADQFALLAITLVLAWMTKRFVEDPARTSGAFAVKRRRAFAFAIAGALVILAGSAVPWAIVNERTAAAVAQADGVAQRALSAEERCFGAAAALSGAVCASLHTLDEDLAFATQPVAANDATLSLGGTLTASEYGAPDAEITIALIGDSHAAHYIPAVAEIADENNWRVLLLKQNNCSPSTATWSSTWPSDMADGCQQWRKDLHDYLPGNDEIDVIVTSSVAPRYGRTETTEVQTQAANAFTEMWAAWIEGGKSVVVIADVPGPGEEVGEARECIEAHPGVVDPCTAPRSVVLERDAMVVAATSDPKDGLSLVDLTDAYCDEDTCHTVVGGLIVYGGGAHISRLFALSLIPYLQPAIGQAVGLDQ
ncbi:acyltransferase family protein [Salinibacterium sp. ZJ450]|uniref:acyltransferase family protein n=1 Tax=Salinibacterium sp. ZJ450 TaxID=2708338 RepID=UPI0014221507|nr:acyltransferase family protein [Salinibacterium sp. ZJ450]